MYNDQPFHNFQHASHVTQSMSKLLQSVVKPTELASVNDKRKDYTLYEYTYGISGDPLAQFAVIFSSLIHDVGKATYAQFKLPPCCIVSHKLSCVYYDMIQIIPVYPTRNWSRNALH